MRRNNGRLVTVLALVLMFGYASKGFGQSLPPVPTPPSGRLLDMWEFSGTNFLSVRQSAPTSLTNVSLVSTWAGNGLQVDATNAAWIIYPVVEPNGHTNLDLSQGTVETWISPDWNTSDGIGNWGRILEVGTWNTNLAAATGAWGLYISPDASTIYFSAQTNGVFTNYLNAPINWNAGDWHHVAITYSATNSALYLEGILVTNGPGISVIPSAGVLSNGFSIGSDGNGTAMLQARAIYNNLTTYNYELSADTISDDYAFDSENVYPLPSSGGEFHSDSVPSPPGGDLGTNGGGGAGFSSPSYTTNDFWLEALSLGTNAYNSDSNSLTLLLHGTIPDITYQLWSTTNLQTTNTIWTLEQTLIGSETTNFVPAIISMTNRPQLFFKALAYTFDSDGDGLPDWWQLKYFGYVGVDAYGDPAGDGWSNLQKYQLGMNPNLFYQPPAPSNFNVILNTNGNVTLSWNPAVNLPTNGAGAVTGYTINFDGTNYTVSASQTNYTFTGNPDAADFLADPVQNFSIPQVSLQVNYANTNSSQSSQPWTAYTGDDQYAVEANIVRGPGGLPTLVVSTIPTNVVAIRVFVDNAFSYLWAYNAYPVSFGYYNTPQQLDYFATNFFFDVPVSSISNGVYSISASHIPLYGLYFITAAGIASDGTLGSLAPDHRYYPPWYLNIPFLDGTEHMQENLAFLLQAATRDFPFNFAWQDPDGYPFDKVFATNYACAGFHEYTDASNTTIGSNSRYLNPFAPFEENYVFRNFVLTGSTQPDGQIDTGVYTTDGGYLTEGGGAPDPGGYPDGSLIVVPSTSASIFDEYNFAVSRATNPPAAVLTNWQYNYFQPTAASYTGSFTNSDNFYHLPWIGINQTSGSFPPAFAMSTAEANLFGLPLQSVKLFYSTNSTLVSQTLGLGDSFSLPVSDDSSYAFFPKTAAPSLATVPGAYYFGRPSIDPLPGDPAFVVPSGLKSNYEPVMITGLAQQFNVGAWAKQAILNGSDTNKFGYLEQYFDKAYLADTNGTITTNQTGVLSEYGEFFPTQTGKTFLVTKPDGSGVRGTNPVYVISLGLDFNHDGTIDTSYYSPDATTSARYFQFWNNNNFDRLVPDSDDGTNYEDDVLSGDMPSAEHVGIPDSEYRDAFSSRIIPTKRDLEDFARLWVIGVSNCLSSLPTGSTVTLSWTDYDPYSYTNDPTIDVFQAADADGGLGYLTNGTIAGQQTNQSSSKYVGRLFPGQSIQLNASQFTNSWAGDHFIWCGVKIGSGQLGLTIADTNGHILAQTFAYIQIKDIKDMYERYTVGDDPTNSPTTHAVLAQNDLPSGDTVQFQYATPMGTNTPYILFVHGWNMELWVKDRFAETAFKRLYWQGYQGRFGAFRWPTDGGFKGISTLATNPNEKDNYDRSEYRAWQSGAGLLNKLTDLDLEYPGHVYLLAHSMGNVAAGEALRLSGNVRVVKTYVASQAAVSAHTYDTNVTNYSFYYPPWSVSADTPNIYGNWFLGNSGGGAGKVINFYNPNDFALQRSVWQLNQLFKPDQDILFDGDYWEYGYNGNTNDPAPWNNFYKKIPSHVTLSLDIVNVLSNRYEVMALAAQSWTTALGATPGVQNVADNIYLGRSSPSRVWPVDATGNNYSAHFWHSAEFRGDYSQMQGYWGELLSADGFSLK